MKIKYIRQEKKSNIKDLTIRVKSDKDEVPNPQFDEYYLYTQKPNYPTGMIAQAGKGAVKICSCREKNKWCW